MELKQHFVKLEIQEKVAQITMDHPPVNSLSPAVIDELDEVLRHIQAQDQILAIVLTGAGPKIFVAGADIKAMSGMTPAEAQQLAETGQRTLNRLEEMAKLTICAINGLALGGGLELAMACDLRICAEHAKMGQPEINLGIIPGFGGTQRLPRIIGSARALEMLLSGDPINAQTAHAWGLVNHVTTAEELLPKALELAQKVASKAPVASRLIHQSVTEGLTKPLSQGLRLEIQNFQTVFASEDKNEGITAFVEKRQAVWKGI
jgi:enoyl-CoA hydratase